MKIFNRKKIHLLLIATGVLFTFAACEDIDEVPPMKDSTSGKTYKIPDPEPMNASDVAAFNSIRDEYEQATK